MSPGREDVPVARPRRMALVLVPHSLTALVGLLRELFGPRARRLLIEPVLGVCIAVTETAALLSIVRLLVLLVERRSDADVHVFGARITFTFAALVAIGAGGWFLSTVARVVEARLNGVYQARAVETVRRAIVEAWFGADWEQLRGARLGRLQQLLAISNGEAAVPVSLVSTLSTAAVSLLLYAAIVLATAPLLAALFAGIGFVVALVLRPIRSQLRSLSRRNALEMSDLQLAATSYAALNRELHVYGVEDAAVADLGASSRSAAGTFGRMRTLQRLVPTIYQQSLFAAALAFVVVGRTIGIDAAAFGTATVLAVRSLSYIPQLATVSQTVVECRAHLDEVFEAVALCRTMRRGFGDRQLPAISDIELRAVSYAYEPGVSVLEGVDLHLQAGDRVGIIGPSGAGKTTLVNIIARLLEPSSGEVLVNGRPAREFDNKSWTAQVGLLSQEPILLRESVGNNISFHRPATDQDVEEAARLAAVDGDVAAIRGGFDAPVGDGHSSLSGGQRQRVALARALLGRPSCLILDEPTSAVDDANERLIEATLRNVDPDVIVLVVSHRPGLLGLCSRFVMLDNGRIVSRGSRQGRADAGGVLTEAVG